MPAQEKLLNIGFGNLVLASRVVAVVNSASSPMRRLREDAKDQGRLIDATMGRKTRSLIITDSNHVILCAIQAETIGQRVIQEEKR
ncbi:MAG: Extracellular matrix regulatory protein A [Desulfovibrio sp.]